jgi:hypothetical protein
MKNFYKPGKFSLEVVFPSGGHCWRHQVNFVEDQDHTLALQVTIGSFSKRIVSKNTPLFSVAKQQRKTLDFYNLMTCNIFEDLCKCTDSKKYAKKNQVPQRTETKH